jgi:hypothetical protein
MLKHLKRGLRNALWRLGYDVVKRTPGVPRTSSPAYLPDFDSQVIELFRDVHPYTMTTPERVFALRQSVQYVVRHNIPGDIVECGVWKGGSMMAVARTLIELGATDRRLYLFDTFEGMPPPSEVDREFSGAPAAAVLAASDRRTNVVWAYSPLDDVKQAMASTGYDEDKLVYVPGKVEDTVPERSPDAIALLRLDTDWYESTYHELKHLYPRLSVGGVLILDDYGHWEGARKAVDQYVGEHNLKLLLNRIDYSGRIGVKIEP